MKKAILAIALILSVFQTFAGDRLQKSSESSLEILDLVVDVHSTYSESSNLQAKVVELLGGDGMNPTRMALVLSTGYGEAPHVYMLETMLYSVTRVTFLAVDTVVINYLQDSFDNIEDMNQIQVKKSLQIKALRKSNGELSGEIELTELK